MEGLPGWGISSMPGPPPRQNKHEKTILTRHAHIHSNMANVKWWLWGPNDILRKATGSYRSFSSLVKLQPWFLSLQNCGLGAWVCSERPAFGQNTLMMMIFRHLMFPDICPTVEEKHRKNHTQETCPDRESNPGPLRDRHACYRLFHSGGRSVITE